MIFNGSVPASNNPWEATSTNDNVTASSKVDNSASDNQFEDNFVGRDEQQQATVEASKPFEKLEDSKEYLAALERKLTKLSNPKDAEKSLVKALVERRSDEARRYLVIILNLVYSNHLNIRTSLVFKG